MKNTKQECTASDDIYADLEAWSAAYTRANPLKKLWLNRRYLVRLPLTWPRERMLDLVSFWQRGWRGWSDRDGWNVDIYLATIIPQLLRYLAKTDHGCPPGFGTPNQGKEDIIAQSIREGEGGEEDHEAWKAYLLGIAQGFDDYIAVGESEGEYQVNRYRDALAMMRELFSRYYPYLWS